MSIDLTSNFFQLLLHFRRHDLKIFVEEHDRLYLQANATKDYTQVTAHYYSVMSALIDEYFNGNFHFAPPMGDDISLEESLKKLHVRIGEHLKLDEGKKCLDIGCGIGGVIQDLSETGADFTGVTISKDETLIGNNNFQKLGIDTHCRLIEADCRKMPFFDRTFDTAYAIYSLKYFENLTEVLSEISRVLKPGGLFVVYDLIKTDKYDGCDAKQREIVEGLEYACGMPSLHSRSEIIKDSEKVGFQLLDSSDLCQETGHPFYYCFSSNRLFTGLINSMIIDYSIKIAESLSILPEGFHMFNKIFLSGTVTKIVAGGENGILSGGEIFVFKKM